MSDSVLRYVSTDPMWQPSQAAADAAISELRLIAPEAEVRAQFEDEVCFYDPGENWSGVECTNCGADLESWWGDAMDRAYVSRFSGLIVKTPCCDTTVSLNNLHYVWPAAFGRFALEAENPNMGDTTEEQDCRIASLLGTTLRKIWVRI